MQVNTIIMDSSMVVIFFASNKNNEDLKWIFKLGTLLML